MTNMTLPASIEDLKRRANALSLYGALAHFDELDEQQREFLNIWMDWEEAERSRRGLERRLRNARIGRYKPLVDFDWNWPKQIDRDAISELMNLSFIEQKSNAILVGPNGVGKSTIAQNIAHQAVLRGHTVLYTGAAQMLNELAEKDSDLALRRRLKYYAQPTLLVIDEIGYLSYGNRHADLLFEVINRRYEEKSIIITTNKAFSEWGEVFPNASCVVSLIDRLIHHAEIVAFDGDSYRLKEAKERTESRRRKKGKKTNDPSVSKDNEGEDAQ